MTARGEGAAMPEVSSDPCQRMSDYRTMAVNARMRIFAVLAAAGLEPDAADELVRAPSKADRTRAFVPYPQPRNPVGTRTRDPAEGGEGRCHVG
ncbi:hypothetical protein ACWD6R_32160 [Streptomyces sp. NPDC005151]